jgi:hypothetical protein
MCTLVPTAVGWLGTCWQNCLQVLCRNVVLACLTQVIAAASAAGGAAAAAALWQYAFTACDIPAWT